MPRIPPLDPSSVPDEARQALQRTGASPSARIQAYWPPILDGVERMTQALASERLLPESLIRLALLRAAQIIGCPY